MKNEVKMNADSLTVIKRADEVIVYRWSIFVSSCWCSMQAIIWIPQPFYLHIHFFKQCLFLLLVSYSAQMTSVIELGFLCTYGWWLLEKSGQEQRFISVWNIISVLFYFQKEKKKEMGHFDLSSTWGLDEAFLWLCVLPLLPVLLNQQLLPISFRSCFTSCSCLCHY